MLGASLSFAVMAAATKAVSPSVSAAEIVFIRSLIGSFCIAFLVWRNHARWIGKEPNILIARGVVGFVAMMLYFWCLTQINLATAVMLNYTAPIFAVIIAHFLFGEKFSRTIKIALAFAFIGVLLLTTPQLHMNPVGLIAGLLSGILVGVVHVLIRYSHEEELSLTIIFYFMVIATVGSALLMLKTGLSMPTRADDFWLLIVTVTSVLGQIGMTYSLRTAPVSVVSPFGYITPVLGLIFGWLFWKEMLGLTSLAGCVVIIVCGVALFKHHASLPVQ